MSPESREFDRGDNARMASDVDARHDFVILASFENRHAAEHMLGSLGRGFRKSTARGTRRLS